MNDEKIHKTVLVDEVASELNIKKNSLYIDGTLGTGGHTREILKLGGRVLGIDMDPEMITTAEERFDSESINPETYKLVQGNFVHIDQIAKENNWYPVSGIILDLGVSNRHLKDLERGFSFENPGAILDMRLNKETQAVRACDLLNVLREDQLRKLFEVTLDYGPAKWVSQRVLKLRLEKQIETVHDMLEIVKGLKTVKNGIHEATLPFLALRIAVNSELDNLIEVLPKAYSLLEKDGRLVVISFHSKEDEIVKDFFREKKIEGSKIVNFKPIMAGEKELYENKRARSAKMRVLQK